MDDDNIYIIFIIYKFKSSQAYNWFKVKKNKQDH
jgi:hypothetical protein